MQGWISCHLLDDIEFIMIKTYLYTYYRYKNSRYEKSDMKNIIFCCPKLKHTYILSLESNPFLKRMSSHEIIFGTNFVLYQLIIFGSCYFTIIDTKSAKEVLGIQPARLDTFDICTYVIINNLIWICKFVHFTIIFI